MSRAERRTCRRGHSHTLFHSYHLRSAVSNPLLYFFTNCHDGWFRAREGTRKHARHTAPTPPWFQLSRVRSRAPRRQKSHALARSGRTKRPGEGGCLLVRAHARRSTLPLEQCPRPFSAARRHDSPSGFQAYSATGLPQHVRPRSARCARPHSRRRNVSTYCSTSCRTRKPSQCGSASRCPCRRSLSLAFR